MTTNSALGITLSILVNDLVEKTKEKDSPEIGKVPAPNVGVGTNYTAPVMNALPAMLSYDSGRQLNATLLKL